MTTWDEGTSIAETADGVVVARLRARPLLVDRPSLGTFRESRPPVSRGNTSSSTVLSSFGPPPFPRASPS